MKITTEIARAGLVSAVKVKGADYVYPDITSCQYVKDGAPSCIVGQAIALIDGEMFAALAKEEADHMEDNQGDGLTVSEVESVEFDVAARQGLQAAQSAQDRGESWGYAIEQFDAAVAAFHGA